MIAVSSILGVWLFSLQHRFETARWTPRSDWNFVDAALDGSSWFRLPTALHWLTGNIGYHHVHHLNPRVPNYRLARPRGRAQSMRPVPPLSLRHGFAATFLTLWDEASRPPGPLPRRHGVKPGRDRAPSLDALTQGCRAFAIIAHDASAGDGSREAVLRSRPRGAHVKDWLVPPVLFPLFLILLVVVYAMLRTPV